MHFTSFKLNLIINTIVLSKINQNAFSRHVSISEHMFTHRMPKKPYTVYLLWRLPPQTSKCVNTTVLKRGSQRWWSCKLLIGVAD